MVILWVTLDKLVILRTYQRPEMLSNQIRHQNREVDKPNQQEITNYDIKPEILSGQMRYQARNTKPNKIRGQKYHERHQARSTVEPN